MSISNPFFDYSTNNTSTSPTNRNIPPFLTPPLRRAAATDGQQLLKNKENNNNGSNGTLNQQSLESEQFCVENPFTQEDSNGGGGNGLFDR